MLNTLSPKQRCLNGFRAIGTLTPLTLGVALLTFAGMPAEARPVIVQTQTEPCGTYIIGSPIPSPVPVNPYTGHHCSAPTTTTTIITTPGRGSVRGSTISDSVLVNPVIIAPHSPTRRVIRHQTPTRVIRHQTPTRVIRQPVIHRSPGANIRVTL